tara:strand:+ start:1164 stop:1730 length:567 start_codon:yes stop_codon:yes gene_type:complete
MDEDLATIEAIRNGDESALVLLTERYREPIFRLAFRFVSNSTDARSLTEEIFEKVYFNASKFQPRSSVKSWIFTIAANRCRDHLRREKRYRWMRSLSSSFTSDDEKHSDLDIVDDQPNAAESTERDERLLEMQNAVQSLPEKLRFPFVFCALEGHTQDEAAEILHLSRKTVESRVYRARRELQVMLKQ